MKILRVCLILLFAVSISKAQDVGADLLDEGTAPGPDLKELERIEDDEMRELEKQITGDAPPSAPPQAAPNPVASPEPLPVAPRSAPPPVSPLQPAATPELQLESQVPPEPEPLVESEPSPPAPEPLIEAPPPAPEPIVESLPPPAPEPIASDEPDPEFEKRLARIYEDFYRTRTSDNEWQQIVGERAQEIYEAQTGDTLWDLSEVLFGNGHFWSKLWAENKKITNPHIIEIGDRIVFIGGELAAEPEVQLSESETPAEDEVPEPPVPYQADVDIPRGVRGRHLKLIPPSLPETALEAGEYDQAGFAGAGRRFNISTAAPLQSYVTADVPKEVGEVLEIPDEGSYVMPGQSILVEGEGVSVGDTLTAFRYDKISGEGAYVVHNLGEMKVVEKVRDEIYRVRIQNLYGLIGIGSPLRFGGIPKGDFTQKGAKSQALLRVLMSGVEEDRRFFSDPGYVYFAGGRNLGVAEGQIVNIRRIPSVRNPKSVDTSDGIIGSAKILRVDGEFSTGIVLRSSDVVVPGDLTGQLSDGL